MKHILNNLSEQEKNAIREQHTGGMKLMNEKFHKLVNSKLGDSKPFLAEQQRPAEAIEDGGMGINEVLNLAYSFMNEHCPEGPKDKMKYQECIGRLHDIFGMVIRNLKSNIADTSGVRLESKTNFVSEQIQDRIVPSGPSPSAKPKVVKDKITSPSSTTKPTSPSPMTSSRPTTGTQIQPIQIKIGDFLVNLTTMEKTGQGSKFYGQIRGDKEYQEVLFSCGRNKVSMKKLGDNTVKFKDSLISIEGTKLLSKAAGCDSYVKNQGTSSDMV
jgi:hypothetical protein